MYFIYGNVVYFHCNVSITGKERGKCKYCCDFSKEANFREQCPWIYCIPISYVLSFFYRKSTSAQETYNGITLRYDTRDNYKSCYVTLNNCYTDINSIPEYKFNFYNGFLRDKSMIADPQKHQFTMWGDFYKPNLSASSTNSNTPPDDGEYSVYYIPRYEDMAWDIANTNRQNKCIPGKNLIIISGKGHHVNSGKGSHENSDKGRHENSGKGRHENSGKGSHENSGKGYFEYSGEAIYRFEGKGKGKKGKFPDTQELYTCCKKGYAK